MESIIIRNHDIIHQPGVGWLTVNRIMNPLCCTKGSVKNITFNLRQYNVISAGGMFPQNVFSTSSGSEHLICTQNKYLQNRWYHYNYVNLMFPWLSFPNGSRPMQHFSTDQCLQFLLSNSHYVSSSFLHYVSPCYRATLVYSAVFAVAMCLSVRLSVCLSQAGIISKRLDEWSWVLVWRLNST